MFWISLLVWAVLLLCAFFTGAYYLWSVVLDRLTPTQGLVLRCWLSTPDKSAVADRKDYAA